jgi:diguanylate cyclase (GGDEF)-like protein/PAS domain S-box-containing protein
MLSPRLTRRLRRGELQQQTVADLSLQALNGADRETLFRAAAGAAAAGLSVEYAAVLELQPDGTTVVLCAGHGWEQDSERTAAVPEVHDRESFLEEHGVASSAAMVIRGDERPFGVLTAHSRRRRSFDEKDLYFLRSIANVLTGALSLEHATQTTGRLAAIVETSLDAIVGRTPDGIVTSWNAAAERLFGYSADEMIGRSISILAPPELNVELMAVNHQLKHGEVVKQFETVRIRKDGTRIEVASTVSPIKDANGRIVAASAISRDVTARRQSEAALRASEARVRAVVDSALDAVITIDHEGRILEFNPAAERIFGRARTDVLGIEMAEVLIPPALRDAHRKGLGRYLQTGEGSMLGQRVETVALRADGSEFPIEIAIGRVPIDGPPLFTGYVRDISERKLSEVQLRESEERYRDLFENASEPLATADLEGNLTEVNSAFERALGYDGETLIGSNLDLYLTPESLELAALHRDRKLSGEEAQSTYEQTFISNGGRHVILEVSTRLIEEDGRPIGVQADCRDITARKVSEAELRRLAELNRHQACHDQLTGLPNRVQLQERIEEALAAGRSSGEGFAVIVIDLDRFREINDSLGHDSGDVLLYEVAQRLRKAVRAPDIVARLGGDEFGILLTGLSGRQADWPRRVDQIKSVLERSVFVQQIPLTVEASIGIAFHPEHGDTTELLLQHADVAMYVAKREDRGQAVYDSREDRNDAEALGLLAELRQAIDNHELILEYQPKVDLRTGCMTTVEALVRWQHPTRGLIPPGEFIPIAEPTALIKPLTRYVIEEAIRQCKQWEDDGHTLAVAVNLSTRNLSELDLVEDIDRMLGAWQLEPSRLLLEITESAIVSDLVRTEITLRGLSALGIELAIDDFGTGYTSLSYLAKLPLDQVKIDRSFVARILTDEHDAAIVQAIIHLCHDLGLQVVAEGVEDSRTFDELARLDCDIAQGYHLGRPLAPEKLIEWIDRHPEPAHRAA